jgi:hypothetical protein
MLIIAIGHGNLTDEYSCSCEAKRGEVDPTDVDAVAACIVSKQMLDSRNQIDELLVVENDDVIAHYTWEDGLGDVLPDEDEG